MASQPRPTRDTAEEREGQKALPRMPSEVALHALRGAFRQPHAQRHGWETYTQWGRVLPLNFFLGLCLF